MRRSTADVVRILCVLGVGCLWVGRPSFGEPPNASPLTSLDREDFAWFDKLGYPDLTGARFAQITTGGWSRAGGEAPQAYRAYGFITAEEGDSFSALLLDLSSHNYTRSPEGVAAHERVGFEVIPLATHAGKLKDQLTGDKKPADEDRWNRFGERLTQRAEVFLLARACAARREEQLAHDLLAAAAKLPDRRNRDEAPLTRDDLRRLVSNDLCHTRLWRGIVAFGEPKTTRAELLKEFQFLAEHFPSSDHAPRIKETAELLQTMVAEDKDHPPLTQEELDKLPRVDQIQELIFQLRDQNGQQWSQPGSCDIFLDPRGENSPAARLLALEFDAVPALIETIDDPRWTRSVGFHRNFYFSHRVLRVGDCAQEIIERIAGRGFSGSVEQPANKQPTREERAAAVKREAHAWWQEVLKKGEKQVLIEGVEKADDKSPDQAARLVKRFPKDALAPIMAATRKSSGWQRSQLLQTVGGLADKDTDAFLRDELTTGPELSTRVVAAEELRRRGNQDVIPLMIDVWRTLSKSAKQKPARDRFTPEGRDQESVISFLASSGSPEAVRALGASLAQFGVAQRMEILDNIRSSCDADGKNAALLAVQKQVLLSALDDTEERTGMSGSRNEKSFSDPRICDMAGCYLNELFPDEFAFDLEAKQRVRDAQLWKMRNDWRTKQGLPPLPAPPKRETAMVAAEKLAPLFARVKNGSDDDRRRALAEVQALGVGALPATIGLAAELPADHAAQKDVQSLAIALANIVAEATFTEKSVVPPAALREQVAQWEGKRLTSEEFLQFTLAIGRELPEKTSGVSVRVMRDEQSVGMSLQVSLLAGETAGDGAGSVREQVLVGGRRVVSSSTGSSSLASLLDIKRYKAYSAAIDQALALPPNESIDILLALKRQEE